MKVLFLTMFPVTDLSENNIYAALLRKFKSEQHQVYVVSPVERRFGQHTKCEEVNGIYSLRVRTLNLQKTNFIEKGVATVLFDYQYLRAVKHYLDKECFDLILYTTPPITFVKTLRYLKNKNKSLTYLMLKDIFPQNAVDLCMMKKNGILYKFFRNTEINLYNLSDRIGCMSPANVDYVLKHNSFISRTKVELCPNAIELTERESFKKKKDIREHYQIPQDAVAFIYGGNLGKPQGVHFLLSVLESNKNRHDVFFVVVGSGTEYSLLERWFFTYKPKNALLRTNLPKKEYDELLQSCDVGMIFLDPRFTIPNYPSRLLSYLEYKKPILVAADKHTDIGRIAEENNYGLSCLSGDLNHFNQLLDQFVNEPEQIETKGENGYRFFKKNYTVTHAYEAIVKHMTLQ